MSTPCEKDDAELWFSTQPAEVAAARAACGPCVIRTHCLVSAIERKEPWGVWGGEQILNGVIVSAPRVACQREGCGVVVVQPKTGRRKAYCSPECSRVKGSEPRPINHGTQGGYSAHRRRGEQACQPCLDANWLAKQIREERRKGRAA